jgi:hypothetical protein
MPQITPTFRIFISSSFKDLVEERNALQTVVFPPLRESCEQHGARFQAIDLRWGISEEASTDQQTMKICIEEIKRCQRITPRPNFELHEFSNLKPSNPVEEKINICLKIDLTQNKPIKMDWRGSKCASHTHAL